MSIYNEKELNRIDSEIENILPSCSQMERNNYHYIREYENGHLNNLKKANLVKERRYTGNKKLDELLDQRRALLGIAYNNEIQKEAVNDTVFVEEKKNEEVYEAPHEEVIIEESLKSEDINVDYEANPQISTKLMLVIPGKQRDIRTTQKTDKVIKIVSMTFLYIFLIVCAIFALFPFLYMIIGSFMPEDQLIAGQLFPTNVNIFEQIAYNYSNTLARFNYFRYVGNTLVVGLCTTCGGLIITILSAFAFARLKFRGRDILFIIFLGTMMIPGEMMVISNYRTMSNLGLIGNDQTTIQAFLAMIIPFLSSVFYIYLLRQNFMQIPNELYLASKVDGKSDWAYLWKVMVPLSSPTLITIFILSLIGSWNAYVWPNLVTAHSSDWLISVAVRGEALALEDPMGIKITQYSWQLTATVLTVVPLLLLFIIFRKYIMRGVGRAGIKG